MGTGLGLTAVLGPSRGAQWVRWRAAAAQHGAATAQRRDYGHGGRAGDLGRRPPPRKCEGRDRIYPGGNLTHR